MPIAKHAEGRQARALPLKVMLLNYIQEAGHSHIQPDVGFIRLQLLWTLLTDTDPWRVDNGLGRHWRVHIKQTWGPRRNYLYTQKHILYDPFSEHRGKTLFFYEQPFRATEKFDKTNNSLLTIFLVEVTCIPAFISYSMQWRKKHL